MFGIQIIRTYRRMVVPAYWDSQNLGCCVVDTVDLHPICAVPRGDLMDRVRSSLLMISLASMVFG